MASVQTRLCACSLVCVFPSMKRVRFQGTGVRIHATRSYYSHLDVTGRALRRAYSSTEEQCLYVSQE